MDPIYSDASATAKCSAHLSIPGSQQFSSDHEHFHSGSYDSGKSGNSNTSSQNRARSGQSGGSDLSFGSVEPRERTSTRDFGISSGSGTGWEFHMDMNEGRATDNSVEDSANDYEGSDTSSTRANVGCRDSDGDVSDVCSDAGTIGEESLAGRLKDFPEDRPFKAALLGSSTRDGEAQKQSAVSSSGRRGWKTFQGRPLNEHAAQGKVRSIAPSEAGASDTTASETSSVPTFRNIAQTLYQTSKESTRDSKSLFGVRGADYCGALKEHGSSTSGHRGRKTLHGRPMDVGGGDRRIRSIAPPPRHDTPTSGSETSSAATYPNISERLNFKHLD